jgi:cystathionine gamma-synthase
MVSFRHAGGEAEWERVRLSRLFSLAESLGADEALIELPARVNHASVAESPLAVAPDLSGSRWAW